ILLQALRRREAKAPALSEKAPALIAQLGAEVMALGAEPGCVAGVVGERQREEGLLVTGQRRRAPARPSSRQVTWPFAAPLDALESQGVRRVPRSRERRSDAGSDLELPAGNR